MIPVSAIRRSVRNFQNLPLRNEDIEKINDFLSNLDNLVGPFGNHISIKLVLYSELKCKKRIANYGVIRNAQGYLLGSCENSPQAIFDYGYVFEGLLLYLTKLDIGTCWLGTSFKRENIQHYLPIKENEVIPAISPLGYPKERAHVVEGIMRKVIRANRRKDMDKLFFYKDFSNPYKENVTLYRNAFFNVRISPTAKNKQPWRVVVSEDFSKVHFYSKSTLSNKNGFACSPEYIDIGIACRNFMQYISPDKLYGEFKIENPHIHTNKNLEYVGTWQGDTIDELWKKVEDNYKEVDKILRKASISEIGGFRPTEDKITSWFGGPGVGLPGESRPIYEGQEMFCLLQVKIDELPYIPPELENTKFLVVFYSRDDIIFDKPNGEGWMVREYDSLDGLQELPPSLLPEVVKSFPIRWKYVEDDTPDWENLWDLVDPSPINNIDGADERFFEEYNHYYQTKFGGFPYCIQSGVELEGFVFQIGSEEKPRWNWVDSGVAYFYKSPDGIWTYDLQFY